MKNVYIHEMVSKVFTRRKNDVLYVIVQKVCDILGAVVSLVLELRIRENALGKARKTCRFEPSILRLVIAPLLSLKHSI